MNLKKSIKWFGAVVAMVVLMSIFIGGVCAAENTTTQTPTVGTPTLTVDKDTMDAGGSVTFAYSATGATRYTLDFGDSSSVYNGTATTQSHTYSTAGTYTAKLTAYNGTVTKQKTQTITVTAKDTAISSVDITLTAPSTGATATDPTSSQHTTAKVEWTPTLTNNKFAGNTNYSATITVTAVSGYVFSSSPTVKLNGGTVTPIVAANNKSFTVRKSFSKTEAPQQETGSVTTISMFGVTVSAAPSSGGSEPTISVSDSANLTRGTITWAPALSNGKFEYDKTYKASFDVTIKNTSTHKFGPTVTVSNRPTGASTTPSVTRNSDSKVTVTIEFSKTGAASTISSVSVTIDAPAFGAKPDNEVVRDTSHYTASVEWYKDSVSSGNKVDVTKTFAANTVYVAKITLEANDGYVFSSSMAKSSVKVNGNAVSKDLSFTDSNKKLTVEYTFPKTGEGQKPVITLSADPANPVIKSSATSVLVNFKYTITGGFGGGATINFGDGSSTPLSTTTSSSTISHSYTAGNTYTVNLSATNNNGTTSKTIQLKVTKESLKASFTASPEKGEAPLSVTFKDASTAATTRTWDFGDGTKDKDKTSVVHTFENEGTYTVKLIVSDGTNEDMMTKTITVTKNAKATATPVKDTKTLNSSDEAYETFMSIGEIGVPSPFNLLAELVRLFLDLLNFDNYTIFTNETVHADDVKATPTKSGK